MSGSIDGWDGAKDRHEGATAGMADNEADGLLNQDDINAALAAAGLESEVPDASPEEAGPADASAASDTGRAAPAAPAEPDTRVDSAGRPFDEVAAAMAVAVESESAAPASPSASSRAEGATPFQVPELGGDGGDSAAGVQGIELLRDVELNVKIELGRSRMLVDDVLRLGEGSVVELDKLAGDPVDVFVNNRLVARGEVLVLNDNFCVRINDIYSREFEEEQSS